jgi:uncharacterized protein with beta-barrel porin domain
MIGMLALASSGMAQDATWLATPTVTNPADGNFNFNANANWNPATAPGSVTQTGTATFGATTTNGANISFSAGATTLSGFTFNAAASNYAFFNTTTNLTFNGAGIVIIGGSATFTNSLEGITTFDNNSTAGSAAFANGGTISFNNTSSGGNATFANNGGAISFGQMGGTNTSTAGSATIMNSSGNGNTLFADTSTAGSALITNSSGGFTTFTGTSTAGGAHITNNGGQAAFTVTSTAGNATITNSNLGFILFENSSSAGSAAITNSGAETQFLGTSTAGNATITNSNGSTAFRFGSTAGSAHITNTNGSVQFADTSSAGSATITNDNSRTVFADSSTAGSAVIANGNGSIITFINNANAGTAAITNNSGQTQFIATSAGSAAITNNSGGTTSFGAASTAGNATITNNNGGATQFVSTGTAGNATITNNNGGATQFSFFSTAGNAIITNDNGTVAFFVQSDGGAAHLINGAGGTIDFSGSTGPNNDNQLNVGSIAGTGTFIVGQQQRVSVSGSLAFTSGALYLVQVSGSSASQIAVAGTATLAGTVEVDVLSRLTQKTTYTILTSSGLNNTMFASVILGSNFASNPTLSYVGGNVLLTLAPSLLSPNLPPGANANQKGLAAAIDNALLGGGSLPAAFNTLFGLSGGNLQTALTQISGETATGAQQTTFDAMGMFMGLLTDPFMNRGGGFGGGALPLGYADEASAYAATKRTDAFAMFTKAPPAVYEPRWSVWAAGFGGSQSTSGNAALGSNNATSNIAATAVGADYQFSPNTIAGFALAGGGTSFSVANGGTGRSDLFQAGAYLRHTSGAAYITGALAYGWQDITTNRTVTVAGLDQLRAEFNTNAWSGRLEGGYRFVTPWNGGIGLTPYAAAQFVIFDLPAYAEQAISGTNNFALANTARDVTDARSELGIRTDKSYAIADGILTLRGRLAWAHDFDPDRSIAATFQALPGAFFVVNGAAQASDSALTTAAIEMKWKNGWSAAATFEGEFSNVTSSYAGKGIVRYQW